MKKKLKTMIIITFFISFIILSGCSNENNTKDLIDSNQKIISDENKKTNSEQINTIEKDLEEDLIDKELVKIGELY